MGRTRLPVMVAGAAVTAAVAAVGAASASPGRTDQQAPPPAAVELQQEVDAMQAGGLPADHPKARMLQGEVDALIGSTNATAVPDRAADAPDAGARGAQATTPEEAVGLEDEVDAGDEAEAGTVECEPVPEALSAAEVAEATMCVSVPQPDGTSRFLAVEPSSRVHVVRFGEDGHVERLADQQLPAGATGQDVSLVPDGDGAVDVLSGGAEVGSLDPG
jgi:hypothetical protein